MDLVVKGLPVEVQPTQLRYAGGRLRIVRTALQVGNGITTRITGDLGLTDGSGHLTLHDLLWQDDSGGTLFGCRFCQ